MIRLRWIPSRSNWTEGDRPTAEARVKLVALVSPFQPNNSSMSADSSGGTIGMAPISASLARIGGFASPSFISRLSLRPERRCGKHPNSLPLTAR
jgi:hypothetical protein